MEEVIIRAAQAGDYDAVAAIMAQVQALHVKWRPDIYRPNEQVLPREAFEDEREKELFYVAECDGKVVGILELQFRHIESPAHVTRDTIFVDSMAVDETYRGRGIGGKMFDFLKRMKEDVGYDGIELQVNARNRAAYEMYRHCGFTEKSINMEMK